MARTKHEEPPVEVPVEPENPIESLVPVNRDAVKSLFATQIGRVGSVRSLTMKRTLTKPLKAMAHEKELLFTCTSDMYTMTLPTKGRGAAPSLARVVDGIDVANGEECTLIFNEMMLGALRRGGYRTLVPDVNDEETVGYSELPGTSLIDKSFAFKQGIMNEEKGYRVVETLEVEVTY